MVVSRDEIAGNGFTRPPGIAFRAWPLADASPMLTI
jgi:hypothetical protein